MKRKLVKNRSIKPYICTLIFAALIGTYLDLWLIGKGIYSFPIRPYPKVFSINILFTLAILPASTLIMIYIFNRINRFLKIALTLISCLLIALSEHFLEKLGLFVHSSQWHHAYSFFGYLFFITAVWHFYKWMKVD